MSGLRNQNINRAADIGKQNLQVDITTAISLTGAVVYSFTPGFKFIVTRIRSYNRVKAGAVSAVVKVGGRTAASIVFTSATEVAQTLSTTLANLVGSATEAITIELTTDGSGVLTNGGITLVIRPYPMNGDVGRAAP